MCLLQRLYIKLESENVFNIEILTHIPFKVFGSFTEWTSYLQSSKNLTTHAHSLSLSLSLTHTPAHYLRHAAAGLALEVSLPCLSLPK